MKYKSFALWPLDAGLFCENPTHDLHDTKEEAWAVCIRLSREGFGGEGRIFPVNTWVEECE